MSYHKSPKLVFLLNCYERRFCVIIQLDCKGGLLMRRVRISVRRLVEFVRRSGSIDNRMTNSDRALEGTKFINYSKKKLGKNMPQKYG